MLQVLCSTVELDEYGEVLSVGDRTERLATRTRGDYYGTELDEVAWAFDRYAGFSRGDNMTISGQVVAIAAIYFRLTREERRGWIPATGTAWLEPVDTTERTRRPSRRITWGRYSQQDEHGRSYRGGYDALREGDEQLSGWRVTLEDEHSEGVDPAGPDGSR